MTSRLTALGIEARSDGISVVTRSTVWTWTEVAGVATDSRDRVFVFNRGEHPLMIFDRSGKFVDSWGAVPFTVWIDGLTVQ